MKLLILFFTLATVSFAGKLGPVVPGGSITRPGFPVVGGPFIPGGPGFTRPGFIDPGFPNFIVPGFHAPFPYRGCVELYRLHYIFTTRTPGFFSRRCYKKLSWRLKRGKRSLARRIPGTKSYAWKCKRSTRKFLWRMKRCGLHF